VNEEIELEEIANTALFMLKGGATGMPYIHRSTSFRDPILSKIFSFQLLNSSYLVVEAEVGILREPFIAATDSEVS
jgi:hypothetical protein